MSKLKEDQMRRWCDKLDHIFDFIDGDDTVLSARAKVLKRLIEKQVETWVFCDFAHSKYTGL